MPDRRSSTPRRQSTDRRTGDRRLTDRMESSVNVRFLRSGSESRDVLQGELLDASRSGIQLLLDEQLHEAETMLIELWADQENCFNLSADVVWSVPAECDRYRVGCELRVDLSQRQFRLLKSCIQI